MLHPALAFNGGSVGEVIAICLHTTSGMTHPCGCTKCGCHPPPHTLCARDARSSLVHIANSHFSSQRCIHPLRFFSSVEGDTNGTFYLAGSARRSLCPPLSVSCAFCCRLPDDCPLALRHFSRRGGTYALSTLCPSCGLAVSLPSRCTTAHACNPSSR